MDNNVGMGQEMTVDRGSTVMLGGIRAIDQSPMSVQAVVDLNQASSSEAIKKLLQSDAREGIHVPNLRVMLADDHEGFRKILSSFLRSQKGVEVVGEAADGQDAVAQADRLHPDLIFMDLHMPKFDGIEATKTIKSRLPLTRVFILSMDASEYHRNAVDVADGFITKQTMKNAVLTILAHEWLRNRALTVQA